MRVYTGGVEERKTADMAPVAETMAAVPATTSAATTRVEKAGRLPSIEMEPKTLTLDQIKYAREAALYVVSTKSEEEAIRIFTAGLKPVQTRTVRNNKSGSVDSSDDDVDLDGCGLDDGGSNTGGRCGGKGGRGGKGRRGRRQSFIDDIRDVATAPF